MHKNTYKSGTALEKQILAGTVKHNGGGIMVWACMAVGGGDDPHLEFIKYTMGRLEHLNILKNFMKRISENLGLSLTFWFQQYKDPTHTV